MDLRSLRYFLAVIEQGSISKASESVHIAQPALGLHIRRLEEQFGLSLVERHSRGIRATEAGELLAKHAEVLLRYADLAQEEIVNYSKVPSGHVSIGFTPTTRETLAVSLVERVSRDLPLVHLTIKEAPKEMLLKYLLDDRLDAALVYRADKSGERIAFEPLASEPMFFVYPLRGRGYDSSAITLAEAMSERLILPTRPHLVRTEIDRVAADLGIKLNMVHEVDSVAAIRDLVSVGLGCSVMPAVRNPAYSAMVGSRRIAKPTIKRLLHLAYSRRREVSRAFQAVRAALKAVIEEEMCRSDSRWERLEPQYHLALGQH